MAYGYLEFQSSTRQTVALKLGSDDGIKVWCNGNLLLSNHLHRPLNPGDDVIRVPVQSGLNRLLVKVDQGVEGWGFVAKWAPLYSTEKDQETSKTAVGLAIYPENHLISTAEPVICTVMTEPTIALDAEVEVVFSSEDGEVLGKKRGFLGEPLELILPRTFTGVALLRAEVLAACRAYQVKALFW